jgi:DnaJ like chaperone protein
MGHDGIIASSTRWACQNMVLILDTIDLGDIEEAGAEAVDWNAWRARNARKIWRSAVPGGAQVTRHLGGTRAVRTLGSGDSRARGLVSAPMSIWTRITETVAALVARGESLLRIFERRRPPEASVAFTIAILSLGAKMAKADGLVARAEVAAFREVFQIAAEDEAAAARVFNLAREDVAGYDAYAARIARMFAGRPEVLADILEGLFHVALADGHYHEGEEEFLATVGRIFGVPAAVFDAIEARHLDGRRQDPWAVLGVARDAELATVRARWRELVRQNHPDRMIARGLPVETVNLANARLAQINRAWEEIAARIRAAEAPQTA